MEILANSPHDFLGEASHAAPGPELATATHELVESFPAASSPRGRFGPRKSIFLQMNARTGKPSTLILRLSCLML
jgi:hypothetical protein